MRIEKENSAAVVIDIQERLLPHISEGDLVLKNTLTLLEGLKILSVPVLFTQQYTRGLGHTVPSIVKESQGFNFIEKISFSCCGEPSFNKELDLLAKEFIILCGIEAHVCVLQTCLDLLSSEKIPVVVEDCISSRRLKDKIIAVDRMRQEGARITTVESLLFELTKVAGTEVFKKISGIVK